MNIVKICIGTPDEHTDISHEPAENSTELLKCLFKTADEALTQTR